MSEQEEISLLMENEIWKDIEGFEGIYQVSSLGRVKRLETKIFNGKAYYTIKERIIKGKNHSAGYRTFCLSYNKIRKDVLEHRLIAIHFIPNPNNFPCINHKDGNKQNNKISNLEWCSYLDNNQHAYDSGIKKPTWKGRTGSKHCRSKKVEQIDIKTGNVINIFVSAMEASRKLGLCNSSLSACCTGRNKTSGGFKWRYANE